jgi:glutamate--cysteine ligase catalytic subunit
MGLLTTGEPLDWFETKKHSDVARSKGIEQFIKLYKTFKTRESDCFKYGDEVEYSLVKFDHKLKRVYLLLKAEQLLNKLSKKELTTTKWTPEFASFMIEGLPGFPYEHDISCIKKIESNMKTRRQQAQELLGQNEYLMTFSTFPLLGCPDFTWPQANTTPDKGITRSLFFPDDAIFKGHPKYAISILNNRTRRKAQSSMNIPIFMDINTPKPFIDDLSDFYGNNERETYNKLDHIYLEGIGASCSCLQVTFQASNLNEARILYDQLTPLTPILLALSASSPIWRGYLSDIECRWQVISQSLDDRTPEEKGELPLKNDKFRIFKSRYDSIDCYLSNEGQQYNDIPIVKDEMIFKKLINEGVDSMMAQHISHLFIRDPLILFKENLSYDDKCATDLFENIQSTNWQSMRFKPPPQCDLNSNVGWRVEFRTTELQFTDYENAAFVSFLVLITRVILSFKLDLLIPISNVDENMKRAQKRNSCLNEKFYFKVNDNSIKEISINEIINGGQFYTGLIPMIRSYLSQMEIDCETDCKITQYLKTIENKANGKIKTAASWMRDFVMKHPSYKFDSKVNNEIAYDLMWHLNKISSDLIDLESSGLI